MKKKRAKGNSPAFPLDKELLRITGVDFTRIDGMNVMTAQTVISEVGLDMTRWTSESHFASWLGLCPNNAVSGGRVLRRTRENRESGSHRVPHCRFHAPAQRQLSRRAIPQVP